MTNFAAKALILIGHVAQHTGLAGVVPNSVMLSHSESSPTTSDDDSRPIGIIIMAQGRSGSTLLGETFRQHQDVLYFYEPCRGWGKGLFGSSSEFHRELHGEACSDLAHRLVTCEFTLHDAARLGIDPAALGSGSPGLEPLRVASAKPSAEALALAHAEVVADCKRKSAVVVKTIRADAGVRATGDGSASDVLVVHLVRDPRAVIHSQIKNFNVAHKYRRYFGKSQETNVTEVGDASQGQGAGTVGGERGMTALPWAGPERARALGLIVCGVYKDQMDSSVGVDDSRYLLVRYEDIASSPESMVEHIYRWSGLGAVPSRVSLWLHENTRLPDCVDPSPPAAVTTGTTAEVAENQGEKLLVPLESAPIASKRPNLRGFEAGGRSEPRVGAEAEASRGDVDNVSRRTIGNNDQSGGGFGGESSPECAERTAQQADWNRYGTKRHAAVMAMLWRTQMPVEEAAAVWEACEDSGVMARIGYNP